MHVKTHGMREEHLMAMNDDELRDRIDQTALFTIPNTPAQLGQQVLRKLRPQVFH